MVKSHSQNPPPFTTRMTSQHPKDNPRQIWEAVLGELELQVPRPSFETWLKGTAGARMSDSEFVVITPNAFVAEMLDQRMYSLIAQSLEKVVGDEVEVRFEVGDDGQRRIDQRVAVPVTAPPGSAPMPIDDGKSAAERATSRHTFRHLGLNSRYRFESYIVGSSNNLAHAAADAVSEKPGELYNPLVIYSGVGLGKTHLMHAIGHRVREKGHDVLYSTTEEFTNEYIKAIRGGTTEEFRDRYRSADVLLLDDIQFIIGKEQTQEGFFHTFNALHMAGKQIVITSDRPVTELSLLQDRISSRLAGGLVADIQAPDLETRLAILRSKADQTGRQIPNQVLEFIAQRVQKNVRELEGCLNRVAAYVGVANRSFDDGNVDLSLVERALEDSLKESTRRVSEEEVLSAVARYFSIDKTTLKGKKRDKSTALARHVSMFLLREEVQLPLATIGRVMGGRDHTTVMHGVQRIAKQLEADTRLRRDLLNIRESLAA